MYTTVQYSTEYDRRKYESSNYFNWEVWSRVNILVHIHYIREKHLNKKCFRFNPSIQVRFQCRPASLLQQAAAMPATKLTRYSFLP
jgi:hypothetical protein